MAASASSREPSQQGAHAEWGQQWGAGAARCFCIQGDFLDPEQGLRLAPVPDSFLCPISASVLVDPVATVDGFVYERSYIEQWFRSRRQERRPITSPLTGLELQSTTLMPLLALQRAIETYLAHRPEIRREYLAGRSFEEAAKVLQAEVLEKETYTHDEVRGLKEATRVLKRDLQKAKDVNERLHEELRRTRRRLRSIEDEHDESLKIGLDASICCAASSEAATTSNVVTASSGEVAHDSGAGHRDTSADNMTGLEHQEFKIQIINGWYDRGTYIGTTKNGKPYGERHGQGRMSYTDGDFYDGQWNDDKRHGHGVLIVECECRYEGHFREDKRHGPGVYIWDDGSKYEGQWKDDMMHGRGTYTSSQGKSFTGTWKKDSLDAKGCDYYDTL